jgi:hypothetical protein
MGTVTVRPDAVQGVIVGSVTLVGAASFPAALSDNNSGSYAEFVNVAELACRVPGPALPANARWNHLVGRVQLSSPAVSPYFWLGVANTVDGYYGPVAIFNPPNVIATYSTPQYALTKAQSDALATKTLYLDGFHAGSGGTPQARAYEYYLDAIYALQPVCDVFGPTGTISDRTAVTVQYTHTAGDADGGPQAAYHGRVFTAAQYGIGGFNPETSPSTYDTGRVGSSSAQFLTADLAPGVYRAYVRTSQSINGSDHWSAWDFVDFTIALDAPDLSAVVATVDGGLGAGQIAAAQLRAYVMQIASGGAASGELTTPGHASLDFTGDFTIQVYCAAVDWTPPTTDGFIVGKNGAGGNQGFALSVVQVTGILRFYIGVGGTFRVMESTAPGLTDGQGYWLEVFYNNTAKTARFRKSSDPSTTDPASVAWTTINTTAAHAGGSPSPAAAQPVFVGRLQSGDTQAFVGKIARLRLLNAAAAVVADANIIGLVLSAGAPLTFVDSTGKTWTKVNPAAWVAIADGEFGVNLWDYAEFEASEDGGATWRTVHGSTVIPVGDVASTYDAELRPDVTTMYRARGVAVLAGGTAAGPWVTSNSILWEPTVAWIKHLYDMGLSLEVCFRDFPTEEYEKPTSLHRVLGRSRPVAIADVVSGSEGDFAVATETTADAAAVRELLGATGPLLIQIPEVVDGVGTVMYVAIGRFTPARLGNAERTPEQRRMIGASYTEVDRPETGPAATP